MQHGAHVSAAPPNIRGRRIDEKLQPVVLRSSAKQTQHSTRISDMVEEDTRLWVCHRPPCRSATQLVLISPWFTELCTDCCACIMHECVHLHLDHQLIRHRVLVETHLPTDSDHTDQCVILFFFIFIFIFSLFVEDEDFWVLSCPCGGALESTQSENNIVCLHDKSCKLKVQLCNDDNWLSEWFPTFSQTNKRDNSSGRIKDCFKFFPPAVSVKHLCTLCDTLNCSIWNVCLDYKDKGKQLQVVSRNLFLQSSWTSKNMSF